MELGKVPKGYDKEDIIWVPNPGPQTFALKKIEDEILFGGARGGGKTDAGMVWVSVPHRNPKFRGLVIRRNATDLSDWIDRAKKMYERLGAQYKSGEFRFPSGALIRTGHLADEQAYEKYQGHEYQRILLEELTHIPTLELYLKLTASCRSTVPELVPQVFATTNPGGPGHKWVKKRFIDTAVLKEHIYKDVDGKKRMFEMGERYIDPKTGLSRVFIRALVDDNPYIVKYDPRYIQLLEGLPDDLRMAWREGSWDSYEIKGAYYTQQLRKMRQEGRITTVPFDPSLPVDTWWDLGRSDANPIGFFQQKGGEWRMIDFYINEYEALPHYINVINQYAKEKGYNYRDHWAPHDIEVNEYGSGETRKETARKLGITFKVVPKQGIEDGIDAVRRTLDTLWVDAEKCEYFIDALTNYRKKFNQKLGEFINTAEHDWASHPADMIRYFAMTVKPSHTSRLEQIKARRLQEAGGDDSFDPYAIFK